MTVDIPLLVALEAEDRELGEPIGRYPQAINKILVLLFRGYGALFGMTFVFTVYGGSKAGDPAALLAGAVLLGLTVGMVLLGERIRRNRAFYLYPEGVVATWGTGHIAGAARWEDIRLYWGTMRTGWNGFGPLRDEYRLVADGRTVLRHGEPADSGPGLIMRQLSDAKRTPVLARLLRSGEAVPFGPLTAIGAEGLVYRQESLPWATIDHIRVIPPYQLSVRPGLTGISSQGRRFLIRSAKVPDLQALIQLASFMKMAPGFFSEET
ncbi:DUF6585 family protein [Streptomyces sp. NPDC059618]|uniref:DUF6585 family protein n=1 Tax=Streptomyces sp. NPDC059618 TaxID=3346887 RepID=UPI0036B4D746